MIDVVILMCGLPCDHAVGLEAREQEGVDELLERHAVLQAERDGDGEAVRHAAEGGAFLVHVDEDLAERAVLVLAGAQVDLVVADAGLLRVAGAAVGQPAALARCSGGRSARRSSRDSASASCLVGATPAVLLVGASATVLSGWLSFEPSR